MNTRALKGETRTPPGLLVRHNDFPMPTALPLIFTIPASYKRQDVGRLPCHKTQSSFFLLRSLGILGLLLKIKTYLIFTPGTESPFYFYLSIPTKLCVPSFIPMCHSYRNLRTLVACTRLRRGFQLSI